MSAEAPDLTSADDIAALIDHTLLKPEATHKQIDALCAEARMYRFSSVCVNPVFVERAAKDLNHSDVAVCTVVGFPLGANRTAIKEEETRLALEDGATEIDMVLNIGALIDEELDLVFDDIAAVAEICNAGGALCKVIFETCLLNDEQKLQACALAVDAKASFVKTSTGFSTGGATVEDVRLMSEAVSVAGVEVKASGGIRTLASLREMVEAGATRIGASAGVKIIGELTGGRDKGVATDE